MSTAESSSRPDPRCGATGSLLVGLLTVVATCLGFVASSAGASTSKGQTITVTITPSQWYGIQHINTNGRVMNASQATHYLFDFMCTTFDATPPPTPSLVSRGSKGVTFRIRLSAKQVATLNKEIRNDTTCGKVHNVQQEYNSAYAEEVATAKQVNKSAATPTTTPIPSTTTTTAPPTATFACSGTAPEGVSITYGSDTQNIDGGSTVPWQASLPIPADAQYESVSAQLQGPDGSISCTVAVTVDGTTTSQMGQAVGNYNIAQAQVCNEGDELGGWQTC